MAALTSEQLDDMTKEETAESLRMILAYATMADTIAAIIHLYEYDDRQEIAEQIGEMQSSEEDFSSTSNLDDNDDC